MYCILKLDFSLSSEITEQILVELCAWAKIPECNLQRKICLWLTLLTQALFPPAKTNCEADMVLLSQSWRAHTQYKKNMLS